MRIITAFLVLVTPTSSFAWNPKGHRVIASIAYRQLDEQTKRKIAEVLKKHPAYADLWANRRTNGPDEVLELVLERLGLPGRRSLGALETVRTIPSPLRELPDSCRSAEPGLASPWGREHVNSNVAHLHRFRTHAPRWGTKPFTCPGSFTKQVISTSRSTPSPGSRRHCQKATGVGTKFTFPTPGDRVSGATTCTPTGTIFLGPTKTPPPSRG